MMSNTSRTVLARAAAGPRRRARRLAVVLLPALAGLASLAGWAAEPVSLTPEQQRAFGIELAPVAPAASTLTRRWPARVAVPNPQLQVVAARQAGVLEALLVAEGEQVTAGQVLARLQSPDLVAIQSDFLEALTRLTLAESEVARDRMLQREGVIAERRLLESRARRDELQTLAAQRRQVLALAGMSEADIDRLAETRTLTSSLPVRAPIGGVVLEQMVSTGESVPAAAPLYQIADLSALWVEVHVPVEQLEGIGTGSRALLSESGIEARIVTVGRLVHGEDQGVLVRAKVTDGAERLRPGQFVEVQLATATAAGERWRLPAAAVVRQGGKTYVFIARGDAFAPVPVALVAEEEGDSVVSGPLTAADRVVVAGVIELKAAWLGAAAAAEEAAAQAPPVPAADGGAAR